VRGTAADDAKQVDPNSADSQSQPHVPQPEIPSATRTDDVDKAPLDTTAEPDTSGDEKKTVTWPDQEEKDDEPDSRQEQDDNEAPDKEKEPHHVMAIHPSISLETIEEAERNLQERDVSPSIRMVSAIATRKAKQGHTQLTVIKNAWSLLTEIQIPGVIDNKGKPRKLRGFIDCGSTISLINTSTVNTEKLKRFDAQLPIDHTDLEFYPVNDAKCMAKARYDNVPCTAIATAAEAEVTPTTLYAAELSKDYDILLGMDWLTDCNPDIDWKQKIITLRDVPRLVPQTRYVRTMSKQSRRDDGEVSLKVMRKINRKNPNNVYMIHIKDQRTALATREGLEAEMAKRQPRAESTHEVNAMQSGRQRVEAVLESRTDEERAKGAERDWGHIDDDRPKLFLDQPVTAWECINATMRKHESRFKKEMDSALIETLISNTNRKAVASHRIDIKEGVTKIPNRPYYRMSIRELEELRLQLDKYLDAGMIEPSRSPYGAAVLFAPKKGGKLRFCVDYRPLNDITVKNAMTGPSIEDCLNTLQGSTIFSAIDLAQGYHQIPIREEDKEKTAFNTKYGHYQWRVLPFGLCNAPATFVQTMHQILSGEQFRLKTPTAKGSFEETTKNLSAEELAKRSENLLDICVSIYIDDIIIFSRTPEEHAEHLDKVLTRLEEYDLYIQSPKSYIARREVEYLGHMVSADGIKPCDDKLKTVTEWPQLRTPSEARQFLGFTGFYRKFIEKYAQRSSPLREMTKQNAKLDSNGHFEWTPAIEASFNDLKQALCSAPVLRIPNPRTGRFHLMTDASGVGLGATLMQWSGDGDAAELHPVAYLSRALKPEERNEYQRTKVVYNLELKALMYAVEKWRIYLEGQTDTTVDTDHNSLIYLQKQKDLNRTQTACLDALSRCDLKIRYIKGEKNIPGDAPSRRPDYVREAEKVVTEMESKRVNALRQMADQLKTEREQWYHRISEAYKNDPKFAQRKQDEHYRQVDMDGVKLWYYVEKGNDKLPRLCIPADDAIQQNILSQYHNPPSAGHYNGHKMADKIKKTFHWEKIEAIAAKYTRECDLCQKNKHGRKKIGKLVSMEVLKAPWSSCTLDFVGPLPTKKNKAGKSETPDFCLVIVCRLTKNGALHTLR